MGAYRSSTNSLNGNAELSSRTCLLENQSKEVKNAIFTRWLLQELYSMKTLFITQVDILENIFTCL